MPPLDRERAMQRIIEMAEAKALWQVTFQHRDLAQPYVYTSAQKAVVSALAEAEHEVSMRFKVNLLRFTRIVIEPVTDG